MTMIGQRIGNFQIESVIGAGGMGTVYLAHHVLIAKKAAIKVLALGTGQAAEEAQRRFLVEAEATSRFRHPGVIETFDCGFLPDGQAYIVMELLEGCSLADFLRRAPSCGPDLVARVGVQVGEAVGAAHAAGLVHRDLKPDNIFLCDARLDALKVLDFGVSKLLGDEAKGRPTRTGMILGTPTYMSPEQCRGRGLVDQRADIYSLGCILYKMAVGKPPFERPGLVEVLAAHMFEPPLAPASRGVDLPPGLETLIMAMLAKEADDRPPSMAAVVDALQPFLVAGASPQLATTRADAHLPPTLRAPSPLAGGTLSMARPPRSEEREETRSLLVSDIATPPVATPARPARNDRRATASAFAAIGLAIVIGGAVWRGRRHSEDGSRATNALTSLAPPVSLPASPPESPTPSTAVSSSVEERPSPPDPPDGEKVQLKSQRRHHGKKKKDPDPPARPMPGDIIYAWIGKKKFTFKVPERKQPVSAPTEPTKASPPSETPPPPATTPTTAETGQPAPASAHPPRAPVPLSVGGHPAGSWSRQRDKLLEAARHTMEVSSSINYQTERIWFETLRSLWYALDAARTDLGHDEVPGWRAFQASVGELIAVGKRRLFKVENQGPNTDARISVSREWLQELTAKYGDVLAAATRVVD